MAAGEETESKVHDEKETLPRVETPQDPISRSVDLVDKEAEDSEIHKAGHSQTDDEHERESGSETETGPDPDPYSEHGHSVDGHDREGSLSDEEPQLHLSRTSSVFSRTQSVIPRSQRRGILARLAVIPEVDRPYDYKDQTKYAITAIIALAAGAAPIGSGIFYPALTSMAQDLNSTQTITNLAVALYMLSMSIFPLWCIMSLTTDATGWNKLSPRIQRSSFSENIGRRSVYVVSFSLFLVFSILSAVSVNITMLIVVRVFAGGAAASVQAVGAGTIADIWEPARRGRAMGIFYLGPLIGPIFAPIIGGALSEGFGWRSTMWFLVVYGGLALLLLIFALPETLARKKPAARTSSRANDGSGGVSAEGSLARVSTRQSIKDRTKKTGAAFKQLILDPLEVLAYLRFPAVAISVYSAAVAFGSLFVLNISIQSSYSKAPYGFSEIIVGLTYFPLSIGYVLASVFGGRWIDQIMAREARNAGRYDGHGKLILLPEDRMRENMWLAASLYPAALIWFGWTIEKGVHWVVPCIASFFFGLGSMLVFGTVTTVLTEFMPSRSSGGVAVNNFVRNIFSCTGAIVAQPLINAMGVGWLTTMIGLFAWITGNIAIWALRRWGSKWRVTMDEKMNKTTGT